MLQRFRKLYRIEFGADRIAVALGSPPPQFVAAVSDIARLHGIKQGSVECVGSGRHARLRFSKDCPQRGRQAIRNAWSAPSAPGGSGGRRARG